MHSIKGQRWIALAAAFGFTISTARAEMITPDSIPNPPAAVGSGNGTPVYANNLVSTQYMSLGLDFGNSWTAITHLNSIPVWVPVGIPYPTPGSTGGQIDYNTAWWGANLNSLTTRNPITVSSLTVETVGNLGFLSLGVIGRNGLPLNIAPVVQSVPGSNGEEIWTFTGSGIWGFYAALPPGEAVPAHETDSTWGVAAVSFTPPAGQTPEPSSLLLAGLGALGLAARFGWRRLRLAA